MQLRDPAKNTLKPKPSEILLDPAHIFAWGFGAGLSPVAPGTVGTLVAIPIFLLAYNLSLIAYLAVIAVMFAFGVYVCGASARKLGVHDHGGIVWDEFVGYLVTMIPVMVMVPSTPTPTLWPWVLAGFLLFRIFDVFKPPGARWSDKNVHGGFGIMLDDFIASLYSAAAMWLLLLAAERFL